MGGWLRRGRTDGADGPVDGRKTDGRWGREAGKEEAVGREDSSRTRRGPPSWDRGSRALRKAGCQSQDGRRRGSEAGDAEGCPQASWDLSAAPDQSPSISWATGPDLIQLLIQTDLFIE